MYTQSQLELGFFLGDLKKMWEDYSIDMNQTTESISENIHDDNFKILIKAKEFILSLKNSILIPDLMESNNLNLKYFKKNGREFALL